jgi:hypothetical protein
MQNPHGSKQRKRKCRLIEGGISVDQRRTARAQRTFSVPFQMVIVRPLNLVNWKPANGSQ